MFDCKFVFINIAVKTLARNSIDFMAFNDVYIYIVQMITPYIYI